MGLFGSIAGAIGGKVLDIGSSFLGKNLEDKYINDPNSAEAYRRQVDFYRNRYQWMLKDMKKAGLNPILAAGSAGFSTSGTPSVAMSAKPTSDTDSFVSNAKEFSEMGKIEEERKKVMVEQLKTMAEAYTEIEKKFTERAKQGQLMGQEKEHMARIQNLWQEIHKMRDEQGVLKVTKQQAKVVLERMQAEVKKLKRYGAVYESELTKILAVIRSIADAIGLSSHAGAGATSSVMRIIK